MMQMLRWQVSHGLGGQELLDRLTPLLERWELPVRLPWDGAADYLTGTRSGRRSGYHRRGSAGRGEPSADGTPGVPAGGGVMDLRLYPAPLRGAVTPPPSKSLLHRQLICLTQAGSSPAPRPRRRCSGHGPASGLYHQPEPVIDCGASGSTLRFLLPLAMPKAG